jgi:hypothetical protein
LAACRIAAELECVLDQAAQDGQVDRLADEVERARLERAHRGFLVAECGDHRHRGLRVQLGDLADQLHSRPIGQAHVGQAQRVLVVAQQCARVAQRRGGVATQAHSPQREHQQFPDVAFVVDDQGAGLGVAGGGAHVRSR